MSGNTLSGSISKWSAYQECPRGTLARALRLESGGPKPDYLITGSIHHDRVAQRILTGAWPTASSIEGWHPGLDDDLAFLEARTNEILEILHLDEATDVQVERQRSFKADWTSCEWDDPDAYWRGIEDLSWKTTDGKHHVLDWKTGRKVLKGVPDVMAFQIRSYAIEPFLDGHLNFRGYAAQVRGGPWGVRNLDVSPSQVTNTIEAIEGWMRVWQSRPADDPMAWPASTCRMCEGCAFAADCPELQGQLGSTFKVPTTPEAVVELAMAQEAHEKVAAHLKRLISEATEKLGPVPLPTGKTVGHLVESSRVIDDADGIIKDFAALGGDKEALEATARNVTLTVVGKMAKLVTFKRGQKKKAVDAIIAAHSHLETSTKFTAKDSEAFEASEETSSDE